MPLMGSVFLQGLALSLGLIVAIGAQNAFVLRQGLRREHVASVVLFLCLGFTVSVLVSLANDQGETAVISRYATDAERAAHGKVISHARRTGIAVFQRACWVATPMPRSAPTDTWVVDRGSP